MKKLFCSTIVSLLISPFLSGIAFAGGSLHGNDTCPVPSITGVTESLTFVLQGPTPPAGARITNVTGSCSVYGDFPDTTLIAGGRGVGITSSLYYTSVFADLSPTIPFTLTMRYQGDYGEPSGATPGNCQIDVSWKNPAPQSTNISGATEVERGKTIELDGTVTYASNYTWTTTDKCSFVGDTNIATVTVKGDSVGTCVITREACNTYNECITDTYDITVTAQAWLIPIYYLLDVF